MKALSIRQPWAWAIINAGKTVENRDWKPDGPNMREARRLQNSDIALHAGKGMTRQEYLDYIETARGILHPTAVAQTPEREDLERGGIVAVARFVGIIHIDVERYETRPELDAALRSPWFFGPYGLVFTNVRRTRFARMVGALGFFDAPDSIIRVE